MSDPAPSPSARSPFPVLDTGLLQAAEEKAVLEFWKRERVFERSVDEREDARSFVFYEGPPTTNGRPGVHHVLGRTVKDVICRFWTMKGYKVRRKAGWDTHGLPVEIEVEKELGIEGKKEIEAFGLAEFNARCRTSVLKYKDEWDSITERIGFWLDLEHPYITMENDYIESVWWCLRQFWDKGLIYAGFKVVPYCPRCQTALSDHEVSQGYRTVTDPSVTVKFPLVDEPGTFILAWTTTPWTLPGNVALAVHEDLTYVKVKDGDEHYIVARDLLETLHGSPEVVAEFPGRDLVGRRYRPLFEGLDLGERTGKPAYRVAAADFVTTGEGTGVVHTAVMYGADDYALGEVADLPKLHTVDETGHFKDFVPRFGGERVREIDPEIIRYLDETGLLYGREDYEHSYPFCWRCDTALLYYARDSWYLRTTAFKERMQSENAAVAWFPRQVGENRFGNWLENNVDWAISRDRFWGTPFPLWSCRSEGCGEIRFVGGRADIESYGGRVPEDLHRPHVDDIVFPCPACDGELRREASVIDVWFDSGSMPFAQWHYPFENREVFEASFPASFVSEGIDQSRGWFYSLLAISTLITDRTPFRAVVSNEMVLDAEGRKMSKRLGNTVDSWEILDREGADALRWYLLVNSPPWVPTRFAREGVTETARRFFGTLRNVAAFFATYANVDGWLPPGDPQPVGERPVLDRWILSRLDGVVSAAREDLEGYQLTRAARGLTAYVQDDLSNWYVRRNRRRFWKGDRGPDKESAYATLHEALSTVARAMAPLAPFLAETLHRALVAPHDPGVPESVHLCAYPEPDGSRRDPGLEDRMARAVAVTELARSARSQAGIKVRMPLGELVVMGIPALEEEILEVIRDEINVKRITFSAPGSLLEHRLKPNFKALGPRFGAGVNPVARAIQALGGDEVKAGMTGGVWTVRPEGGEPVEVGGDEVEILAEPPEGFVVLEDGALQVALDTRRGAALEREGRLRELVHRLQNLRKELGLEVTDRVRLRLGGEGDMLRSVEEHREFVLAELLADDLEIGARDPGHLAWDVDGESLTVHLEKASS